MNDLLEQLRIKDVSNIKDVQYAILETNGQLSVFPKVEKRPATPQDLNISVKKDTIPIDLVIDGSLMSDNLKKSGHNYNWLTSQLKNKGIHSIKNVLFATLDSEGNFFVQGRN
jgi:uncharacterized membrane protein YcaP (DUF421 family)